VDAVTKTLGLMLIGLALVACGRAGDGLGWRARAVALVPSPVPFARGAVAAAGPCRLRVDAVLPARALSGPTTANASPFDRFRWAETVAGRGVYLHEPARVRRFAADGFAWGGRSLFLLRPEGGRLWVSVVDTDLHFDVPADRALAFTEDGVLVGGRPSRFIRLGHPKLQVRPFPVDIPPRARLFPSADGRYLVVAAAGAASGLYLLPDGRRLARLPDLAAEGLAVWADHSLLLLGPHRWWGIDFAGRALWHAPAPLRATAAVAGGDAWAVVVGTARGGWRLVWLKVPEGQIGPALALPRPMRPHVALAEASLYLEPDEGTDGRVWKLEMSGCRRPA
jgi:hypothetical protein